MILGFHFPPPIIEQWNIHKTVDGNNSEENEKKASKFPSLPVKPNWRFNMKLIEKQQYICTHIKKHTGGDIE